jgi:hypothetical protein
MSYADVQEPAGRGAGHAISFDEDGLAQAIYDILLPHLDTPSPVSPKTYHLVYETVDDRGRTGAVVGVFTHEHDAQEGAKGKGWYGGPGWIEKADGYIVGDLVIFPKVKIHTEDLNLDLPKRAKERRNVALAKLTPEEITLLGIKP